MVTRAALGSEVEQEVGSGGEVARCGHEWSDREVAGDYESLNHNSLDEARTPKLRSYLGKD